MVIVMSCSARGALLTLPLGEDDTKPMHECAFLDIACGPWRRESPWVALVVQEMLQGMPLDKLRAPTEPELQLAPNGQVLAPPAAPKARAAQVDIPLARMERSEIRVSCNDRTGLLRSIRATKPLPGDDEPSQIYAPLSIVP